MARYADIDVLLEHLTTSDEGNFRTAITQWLEMHQVEDVAPVVHAHWIKHGEPPWYVIECSECGAKWQTGGSWDANDFCGNCGAKMDEE